MAYVFLEADHRVGSAAFWRRDEQLKRACATSEMAKPVELQPSVRILALFRQKPRTAKETC
jgi:hypothetical protein